MKKQDIVSAFITSMRFQIEKRTEEGNEKGRCIIECQLNLQSGTSNIKAVSQVISVWVNEHKNDAVRAFLNVNRNNIPLSKIVQIINLLGFIKCPEGVLSSNGRTILRYGQRPEVPYTDETDNYEVQTYYESKESVVTEILNAVSRIKQISGLDLVTFKNVSNDLLHQFGFEVVPDHMFNGPDMWRGIMDKIMEVSDGYYANYQAQKDNAESFLSMLEKELSGK